ncbi:hypothetical protein [Corynebacterium cystitidis]|uniref:hypothetical protein n=1 Tax=Corynebacterium cystitidis TaxID=35757 RepID=UPI00211EF19D|nr:hypothetical protein [Corynebacterium cystitidis]
MSSIGEFRRVLINAANASWTRIGRKMMWYCQPGDVVFLLILERKNDEHYFELTLRYALREWIGDDLVATQCGAIAPVRRLVNKHDLELVAHYPGNEKNFESLLFDSMTGNDRFTRLCRESYPDMANLDKRAADLTGYFAALHKALEPLRTLSDIKETFGLQIDEDFWAGIRDRVQHCDTTAAHG